MSQDPIEKFFGAYESSVAKIATQTRTLVRRLVPDAEEKLYPGWKTVAYGQVKKFCAISPHSRWVNLQFYMGAELEDPISLLSGTGKSMRHVKIETLADLKKPALAKLIRAAAKHAG